MKIEREKLDPRNDPLDEWLMQAEFPVPTVESTERLRRTWRATFGAPARSHRIAWSVVAVAAMVCIASAVGWILLSSSKSTPAPKLVVSTPAPPAIESTTTIQAPHARPATTSQKLREYPSRPATDVELQVIAALDRRENQKTAATEKPQAIEGIARPKMSDIASLRAVAMSLKSSRQDRLDALARLIQIDSDASIAAYLAVAELPENRRLALDASRSIDAPPTDGLLRRLNDPRIATRMTAAAVLGYIDGPKTTEKLAELVMKNQNRREALFALAASNGAEAKAFLERAKHSNELASAVASTLAQTAYQ